MLPKDQVAIIRLLVSDTDGASDLFTIGRNESRRVHQKQFITKIVTLYATFYELPRKRMQYFMVLIWKCAEDTRHPRAHSKMAHTLCLQPFTHMPVQIHKCGDSCTRPPPH